MPWWTGASSGKRAFSKDRRPPKRSVLGDALRAARVAGMNVEPKLHHIAAAVADASRARMLSTLLDGRAFTNKELASDAGVTPQTTSGHLAQLQAAGLVIAEKIGRNVCHRLAGDRVAGMLESMGRLAPLDHLLRADADRPRPGCVSRHAGSRAGLTPGFHFSKILKPAARQGVRRQNSVSPTCGPEVCHGFTRLPKRVN